MGRDLSMQKVMCWAGQEHYFDVALLAAAGRAAAKPPGPAAVSLRIAAST
jgi:hypothetical protein